MKWQDSPTGLWLMKGQIKFCIEPVVYDGGPERPLQYRVWLHWPDGYVRECPVRFETVETAKICAERLYLSRYQSEEDARFYGTVIGIAVILLVVLGVIAWISHR